MNKQPYSLFKRGTILFTECLFWSKLGGAMIKVSRKPLFNGCIMTPATGSWGGCLIEVCHLSHQSSHDHSHMSIYDKTALLPR